MQVSRDFLLSFVRETYNPPVPGGRPSTSTSTGKPIPQSDPKTRLSTGLIRLRGRFKDPLKRPPASTNPAPTLNPGRIQ